VIFQDGLIVVKNGKFGDVFRLENIVGTRMVHIVSSSWNEGNEDVETREVACLLDTLDFNHLGQILSDICSVNLRVIWIISVRLHQSECQVFVSHFVHSLAFSNIFPVEFVVTIHKLEVKDILVHTFVDQISIVIVLHKVFVVGFQLGAVWSCNSSNAAIESELRHFLHGHTFHGVLVSLSKVGVDSFRKSPVNFGFSFFIFSLAFLAWVGNAVRNLKIVIFNYKSAPREVIIRLVHDNSLAELSFDCV